MSDKEIVKEFSKDDLTVVWKPYKCIHSENCWRGLPTVFNPKRRPWVSIDAAGSSEIVKQIEQCPSGALSYYRNKRGKEQEKTNDKITEMGKMKIKVFENGPYMVSGEVTIIHKDETEETKKNVALCRCGASENKPFCDGAHKKVAFTG